MRRAYVTRGIPIERCHLIRPGVDFAQVKRRRDDALRARLGFAPDDYVMLAAGESVRAGAHALSVWAASILHVLDPRYRLLLWGRGPLARQAERFAQRTHQHGLMEVAERELKRRVRFEELLGATDAVLVTATAPAPTLPIAVCMAAALPIVAMVTPTVAELLEDRHTALMVGKPAPRVLAQRVLDLRHDPGLQWTISDMARTEAYEYFSLTRFLNQWRAVYRQIATGVKVEVPQQEPGAGLRFHGRI
jgi:glycosyltransferase involved in cell wall biosynthesis